jgi:hypothetical protein
MLIDQVTDLLQRLRTGNLDVASAELFGSLPVADLVREVRSRYPTVFQERLIGHKTELGLAKSLQFQVTTPRSGGQTFASVELLPIFRRCLLLSTYDDHLSGIAMIKSIRIRPSTTDADTLVVAMGRGQKLDRMPDGWTIKMLSRRATVLSESLLRSRGWKFDVLQPFSPKV